MDKSQPSRGSQRRYGRISDSQCAGSDGDDHSGASAVRASAASTTQNHSGDEEDEAAQLDNLFQGSLDVYRKASAMQSNIVQGFDDTDDVIMLNGVDADGRKRASKTAHSDSRQRHPTKPTAAALSNKLLDKGKSKAIEGQLDSVDSDKALQQLEGEKKNARLRDTKEPRTAGSKWYDMPAFPSDDRDRKSGPGAASSRYSGSARSHTAEEMRREVQAIRLRNALDPKRFYKGGMKDKGMPAFAQLGRIISSPLEPSQTLTRSERGRTVVEELIKDTEANKYAKRKFGEHQMKAAAGGRGHYKAKTKKPSDRKRQRK